MEADTAGFVMKLRRLRKQGLGRSSPKAYPSRDVRAWFHRKLTPPPGAACVVSPKACSLPGAVCVVSPEAYPSPGAVSCTASTLHPFFATAACHHLHFAPKHLKHFGGRFTESVPVTRCACVVSPKACSLPGAVSCTASMFCSISATELVATPHLLPSSFDVPERSANGASPNPGEPRRSFL